MIEKGGDIMLGKAKVYALNAVYFLKEKATSKLKSASGMEMLQMVLIIGVAVVIAGGFIVFLKVFMPDFWDQIGNKMNSIFGEECNIGTPKTTP